MIHRCRLYFAGNQRARHGACFRPSTRSDPPPFAGSMSNGLNDCAADTRSGSQQRNTYTDRKRAAGQRRHRQNHSSVCTIGSGASLGFVLGGRAAKHQKKIRGGNKLKHTPLQGDFFIMIRAVKWRKNLFNIQRSEPKLWSTTTI